MPDEPIAIPNTDIPRMIHAHRAFSLKGNYSLTSVFRHAGAHPDPVVTLHSAHLSLGANECEQRNAYRALFASELQPNSLTQPRDAVQQELAFGSERFED